MRLLDPSARSIRPRTSSPTSRSVPRTSIWNRAQVRRGARIGADCIVGRDAFIDEGVVIGDRVKIQNAALVYHGVTVEDGVFIGPNAILTNDRFPRSITADGELARADDWVVSPIRLRDRRLDRRRRRRRRRQRRRAVRDRRRRGRRDARRPGPRARRRQPGAPARLGLRLRSAPGWTATGARAPRDASRRRRLRGVRGPLRDRRRPLHRAVDAGGARVIPISKPDIGPAEEQAVLDVLRSGMLAMGQRTRRVRGGVGRLLRRAARRASWPTAPSRSRPILRALGIGPGDEVDHGQLHLQRDGERHPPGGRAAGVRRRPGRRLLHGPGPGRGGDHAPHEGDHAGPPVRPDGRHGPARRRSRSATASRSSRTRRRPTARRTAAAVPGSSGPAMFSLYATKNLMTGEGGFATTDDDALADRIRLYRNHGMRVRYHHESLGTNFKPTDIAAAIGLAQLARLDERTAQRRRNAARLSDGPRRLPDAARPGRARARLAPVHDALPGRAAARHRRPDGARHRDARSTTRSRSTARPTSRRSCRGPPTSTCRSRTAWPTRSCRSRFGPTSTDGRARGRDRRGPRGRHAASSRRPRRRRSGR